MSQDIKRGREIVLDVKSPIMGADIEIGEPDDILDILKTIEIQLNSEDNDNGIQLNQCGDG